MALHGEFSGLVAGVIIGLVSKGGLLAKLELLRSVHETALLVVHEIVAETYDDKRYVVVAGLNHILKAQALFDNGLSNNAEVEVPPTEVTDPANDVLLRVAPVDSVTRQDQ